MRPVTNSEDEATLAFYRQEAENYCNQTGTRPTASLEESLSHLPAGASILELGCGSGRDTPKCCASGMMCFRPTALRPWRERLKNASAGRWQCFGLAKSLGKQGSMASGRVPAFFMSRLVHWVMF